MRKLILLVCLFAGYLVVACLYQTAPTQASLPTTVSIKLFKAFQPTDQLFIVSPFEVIAPVKQLLAGHFYKVAIRDCRIEITAIVGGASKSYFSESQLRPFLKTEQCTIRSIRPQGICLKLPSGICRSYKGILFISIQKNQTLQIVNQLPIQNYVSSVVGSETCPEFSQEALKAQAVLTQTRLAHYKQKDELNDTTEQEAYLGSEYDNPKTRRATQSVWQQILTCNHLPIVPFYHSTCAGGTSSIELFEISTLNLSKKNQGSLPYLVPRVCNFCHQSPLSKKCVSVFKNECIRKLFGNSLPVVLSYDKAKRPLKIKLGRNITISGYQFWLLLGQRFGWDKVPGTRYQIRKCGQNNIEITSSGAGHGIGLCQWGAHQLALKGKSYKEILSYYFPGTKVELLK